MMSRSSMYRTPMAPLPYGYMQGTGQISRALCHRSRYQISKSFCLICSIYIYV